MTTTPQITRELKQELRALCKDETIAFPYGASDDALAFIVENSNGYDWMKMRAQHEQTIRRCGRSLVAVMAEDENGNPVMNKKGRPVPEFVYTLGQGRKGLPEVLCFYPSSTIGFAINRLCDMWEAGDVELSATEPTAVQCFEDESIEMLLLPLTGAARALAAEKYACQCEDEEPLFLAVAPLPDGSYRSEFIPDGLLC